MGPADSKTRQQPTWKCCPRGGHKFVCPLQWLTNASAGTPINRTCPGAVRAYRSSRLEVEPANRMAKGMDGTAFDLVDVGSSYSPGMSPSYGMMTGCHAAQELRKALESCACCTRACWHCVSNPMFAGWVGNPELRCTTLPSICCQLRKMQTGTDLLFHKLMWQLSAGESLPEVV